MVSSTVQQRDLQKRVALLDHLQHYLHSLGSESRKKHANVKDASEQGIALVKSLQEKLINQQKERQDIRDGNLQLLHSHEELIKPFILACESKNMKLIVIALSALQHLILHGAVPFGGLNIIVEMVARLVSYHQHHQYHQVPGSSSSDRSQLALSSGMTSSSAAAAAAGSVVGGSGASAEEQQVQLKMIQIGLTIVTSTPFEQLNQATISKILGICFRLQGFKNLNVYHTSSAAIRQTTTMLFETLVQQLSKDEHECTEPLVRVDSKPDTDSKAENGSEMGVEAGTRTLSLNSQHEHFVLIKTAYMYLQDLCLFSEGESGLFLNIHSSEVSLPFILELLDGIIEEFSRTLLQFPEFVVLFKNHICTLVSNHLASTTAKIANASTVAMADYPNSLRLYRICRSLLAKFDTALSDECSTFINLLSHTVEQAVADISTQGRIYAAWNKVLILEIFRGLYSDSQLFRTMFEHYENHQSQTEQTSHVFTRSMNAIQSCVKRILVDSPVRIQVEYVSKRFNRLDGTLHDIEPFHTTFEELINNSMDCVAGVVSTISILSGIRDDPKHHKKEKELRELEESRDVASRILESLWGPILSISSFLLDRCEDEEALQAVLRIYLLFTHSCGVVGMASVRDAFLSSLFRYAPSIENGTHQSQRNPDSPLTPMSTGGMMSRLFAQPPQTQSIADSATSDIMPTSLHRGGTVSYRPFTKKNVLVMRVLFSIAHCLGGLLGSSWFVLLKHFESLDRMLQAFNITADTQGSNRSVITSPTSATITSLNPTTAAILSSASNSMSKESKSAFVAVGDSTHNYGSSGIGAITDAALLFSLREDLKILSNALSNLFTSTRYLDDDSLAIILQSLYQLSLDALGSDSDNGRGVLTSSGTSTAPPRLFGAVRLMEVVGNNLSRIESNWEYVSQHLLFLMDHENTAVRDFAVQSLPTLIRMAYKREQEDAEIGITSSSDTSLKSEQGKLKKSLIISDEFEHQMFALLQYAYEDCDYIDTKERLLQSLSNLIHKIGQQFKGRAWPLILTILRRSSDDKPARTMIPLAFKSLQLIGNDMLPNVLTSSIKHSGIDYLKLYMDCCGRFARQALIEDINLSLVSVGLLWSFSDFLLTALSETTLDDDTQSELWFALFSELKLSCIDARPEVRNSALRTLAFVMSSHGGALSQEGWIKLIDGILLPVLGSIDECATQAAQDEEMRQQEQQQQQQQEQRQTSALVMHHSRNNAVKQWSETRCLVIESLSRLIKEHGVALSALPDFVEETIPILCDHIYRCNLVKTSEISKITIRSLLDVVSSTSGQLRHQLWRCCCWQIFDLLIKDCQMENQKHVDASDVQYMVESMRDLFEADKLKSLENNNGQYDPLFEMDDVDKLLDLTTRIMISPICMDVLSLPSLMHKSCIDLIRSLSSFSSPHGETHELVFRRILSMMPSPSSIQYHLEMTEEGGSGSEQRLDISEQEKMSLFPKDRLPPRQFAAAMLQLVYELCFDPSRVSGEIRKQMVHRFVVCLDYLMLTRFIILEPDSPSLPKRPIFSHYVVPSDEQEEDILAYPLWQPAVAMFVKIIAENIGQFNNSKDQNDALWNDICMTIEDYLFSKNMEFLTSSTHRDDGDVSGDTKNEKDQSGDQEEMALVRLIEDICLTNCDYCSDSVLRRMLSILERATHRSPRPVAQEALSCLFRLVRRGSEQLLQQEARGEEAEPHTAITIAQLAVPFIARRSQSILKDFLREEMRTGQMPLPRYRRDQVLNVLHELKESEVHKALFIHLNEQPNTSLHCPGLDGPKGLIIRLFPVFGEFIACPNLDDANIRNMLLEMFRIVSREVGIPDSEF